MSRTERLGPTDAPQPAARPDVRRHRWALIAILTVAAGVRLHCAAELPCISRDGVFFAEFAKQLVDDPVFYMRAQKKQPGYSALLLATHRACGRFLSDDPPLQWERCGQLLALLGGLGAFGMMYLITRVLYDASTGLAAAALAALWPQGVGLSADVLSDMPHLAIYLAVLWVGRRALDAESRARFALLALAGCAGGAAYLLRQEGLGAPLAVGLCLLVPGDDGSWRRRAASVLCVAAAFAVVVGPYAVATGTVMHNKTIWDLLFGPPDDTAAMVRGPVFARHVVGWEIPGWMIYEWGKSGRLVISTLALVGFLWPLVPRSDPRLRRIIGVAVVLQLAATQLRGQRFGEISSRYILIPAALSIPWAAAALRQIIAAVAGRLANGRSVDGGDNVPRGPRWAVAAVAWLVALLPMAYYGLRPSPPGADVLRRAGLWLAEHAAPNEAILAEPRLKAAAFYADRPWRWPADPAHDADSIIADPCVTTAAWFAELSPDKGPAARDGLTVAERALLDHVRRARADANPVAEWSTPDGRSLCVYRLRLPGDASAGGPYPILAARPENAPS